MAVDVRLVTAALVICAANVALAQQQSRACMCVKPATRIGPFSQCVHDTITIVVRARETRCSYMREIPRPPTPDFPDKDYDFSGYSWSERPLLPPEFREEVCMDGFIRFGSTGSQLIYMEEEIEGDVVIARLNYRGNAVPFILPGSGALNLLGPVIKRIPDFTGDWHLVITEKQDYESPSMKSYMFTVAVEGESMRPLVALEIVNIDDNAPIVQVFGPCHIAENEKPGLTRCTYIVSDADGRISTSAMTFELESDRNDKEFFDLFARNEPNEWMWMHLTLELKGELNFAENALHIFRVTAKDSLPNEHTVTVMVEVENVESRPPRWVEILAMAQFDEKIPQEFSVRAVDGDTGINRAIEYRLRTEPEDTFFHITTLAGGGALFNVDAIDRDALEREVFQLSIIAFKTDDEGKEYSTSTNVVIIVNDINDQKPEPFQEVYTIDILEETAMTLNLENFGFHDRDLGQHAQYKVELVAVTPTGAVAGFQVAPQTGYQRQNFIMTTLNHALLDYDMIENGAPTYQNIILRVVATDLNDTTHVGMATVHVNLINWNDELPIFEESTRTVRFRETVEAGYFVAVMKAHDRDIGDRILYQLLGNAGNYLQIDVNTGAITVSFDDAFDYHRQSELFIQVQAVDTLGDGPHHSATSQLVIELIDVNNTPPSIRLPRTRPEVEENVPEGFPIPAEITATDPDTDAELVFEIDWSTSYATKQGRETPAVEFHGCVEIQTTYPDPENKRSAVGKLIVKEIKQGVTIDFEEFEVLYVTVRVRDLKTEIGLDFDEATFTIIIVDMNDNSPVWVEGSLSQAFRVREKSDAGIVIGSVTATDIDGPLYNQVRYTIFPRKDTPDDLVAINFVTGQLTVKLPDAIDADVPPRYHLFYTLRASDECSAENSADCPPDPTINYEDGDIEISILDTNNKVPYPELDKFKQKVFVYENETTGFVIETIVASDLDRDEIYHTLNYQIDFRVNPRLRNFFAMDTETGVVTVNYTTDETLDRDGDEPTHTIFFIIQDNFLREGDGNSNQEDTEIEVILLDVNDNAPELPPSDQLSWTISENTPVETRLQPDIFAPDRDEPDTDNSRVGYAILSLTVTNRDFEAPELFTMVQIENVTGELETTRHLQGYWGTYDIHILAYDHGHPQQKRDETYSLVISVYNFHHPVFVFPQPDKVIRLARERIAVNGLLVKVNQDFLERIEATDDDGEQAGIATFEVDGSTSTNAEAAEYFRVVNDAENSGALILLKTFEEYIRPFTVTIRATDGGSDPYPRYSDVTFTLVFVPTQGEPVFEEHTITVSFVEGDGGMEESFELPRAIDDKNHLCEDDCHTTYYTIVEGNTDGHFSLEPRTNTLYLAHPLDRSEGATLTLQLVATNSPDSLNVLSSNTLTVTVNVREANPRPSFERELYTAGISTQDVIQRALLTVKATHTEEADITYTIDQSTMEVDSSLEGVKDNAFILNASTGVLTLNIQPTASMHGMFEFQAVATDPNGAYDRTDVKIFLISALNRVFFRFRNTLQHIETHIDFIEQTFTAGFRMTCNIDQVVPATDATTGAVIPDKVEVRAHFIRDDLPVPATEIESLRGDVILLGMIQTTLDRELVVLEDFVTDISPGQSDNTQITVYVLIGITVLLGLVCLILLVVFCVRTRTLNRRLQALSTTKYGSVDSGLNRMGITAPGTNKHAVEGSNPIWNEAINAPNFDALSNASNDSDLIGVEDLPQFRNDYFPPASDMELPGTSRNEPVSSHNNNFGFSASPFSPEFGNSNLRR